MHQAFRTARPAEAALGEDLLDDLRQLDAVDEEPEAAVQPGAEVEHLGVRRVAIHPESIGIRHPPVVEAGRERPQDHPAAPGDLLGSRRAASDHRRLPGMANNERRLR
jgi:hypothetical protein